MMRLNKKVIMLTALLIVIGVVVSCSQPTIDKPSIEEPTNPNIQNIINELNRLQNIVYDGNTITSNATKQDIDNFYNYIDEASSNGIDTNTYLNVWGKVNSSYDSKLWELNGLQTPPESWTEEQKTEYNNQIKELLKTDNNTSYASLNENIAKIKEIQNNIGGGQVNPGESSLSIGGVFVENGVVTLTTTNNFDVVKNGDISIKNLTININPTKPSELNIKTLYNLVQELSSYGITPTINTNNQVTYTIHGGSKYGEETDRQYILDNDLYGMGDLFTNNLTIDTEFNEKNNVVSRTITANNTNVKISGNYLDIGENTFIAENNATYTIPEAIKLTNYNCYTDASGEEVVYLFYKPISSSKMIEQFTLFGLNKEMATAPKFDLMLDEATDLFKLSKNLLNKYTTFPIESKLDSLSSTFDGYEEGKSLYNGDVLNTEHQAVKNPINIKLAEFLGQLPSNAVVVCDGQEYTFNQNLYNIVFRGDASKINISEGASGSSHGVILAENQAPYHIPALSNSIYIFKEYPTKNNGKFNGADTTTTTITAVDFSKATNEIKENKIIATPINTLYLKEGADESLLIDSKGGAGSIIRSSPSAQTIQEFEQKGNTALGHFGNN